MIPLPHNAEVEKHVLAVCLLDEGPTFLRATTEGVTDRSFHDPRHRMIWKALERMGTPCFALLMPELGEHLPTAGGFPYLSEITKDIITTAHAGVMITKLRDLEAKRRVITYATDLIEHAGNGSELGEILDLARDSFSSIQSSSSALALQKIEYDGLAEIVKPETVYYIAKTEVCTPGNLTTLYSQAKVGKTAVLGAFISAAMTLPGAVTDNLGVTGPNTSKRALLHFDTEQSKYDRQKMIKNSLRRAGETTLPPWFHSYLLTGKSAKECRALVEKAIRMNARKHGGVFAVLMDGVGDLVDDPNDPNECFPLVTRLHSLAIEFEFPLISVLHLNPSSETKGRGHLGSQLERKSESNLMMEKSPDGVTKLWASRQRGKMITKDEAVCFTWDDSAQMHMSITSAHSDSDKPKRGRPEQYPFELFKSVFPAKAEEPKPLAQLHRAAEANKPISSKQFFNVIQRYVEAGWVDRVDVKGQALRYRLSL